MKFGVILFLNRRFEDMKHYADNLGTNVAAMIKVRQVRTIVYFLLNPFTLRDNYEDM